MADEADHAQEYQERHNAEALALALVIAQQARGPIATLCAECGDSIPEARRKALPGAQRCKDCQDDVERQQKGF